MAKKTPLLTLRPVFDSVLVMVDAVPVCLVAVMMLALLGGTFLFLLMNILWLGRFADMTTIFVVLLVLGFALVPAAYYELRRRASKLTVFHFYDDAIEYQYFRYLFLRQRGRVRLRDISEVLEKPSAVQSQRKLTSIYLVIPSFPFPGLRNIPGLPLRDLPFRAGLREEVMGIIERYGWGQPGTFAVQQPAIV